MSKLNVRNIHSPNLDDHIYHLPNEGPGYDDLKQLYAWSFDDAWKAQNEWKAKNTRGRGPLFRWLGAQELKELYNTHKAGNSAAILEAIFLCSMNSLPIPRWCEMAYITAYRKVRQYKAKSWDDVFGRPHPKGMHLETKRQEREKGFKVYDMIEKIKQDDPTTPIDGFLFETIGRKLGIGGKTLTETYYYKELTFRKRYKCDGCGKRYAHWHDINKDGFCNYCEDKKKALDKNKTIKQSP
ncbi:MAG TPA: hypothetical protein PKW92_06740 [Smithella sp.]|jgi:hypothetical protein|nr:hypothetical protein [Smithella sp.]HOX98472.1 hypothetical protein [Smithella sp.]HPN85800.1 hypothetical protein [Smithella sp.]HPX30761.1 hypothetical protein [Smithella sp.]HQC19212.1 hypothetical protein [Smithella sp.]